MMASGNDGSGRFRVPLARSTRRSRSNRWSERFTVLMAVLLQVGSVTILALGAALVAGWSSASFVALGGLAAIVPNSLFAMRLAFQRGRSAESYPVVFFLGQFAKIGLTVGLLAAIAKWGAPVQWLPLLLGLIVALKAPLFALLYVRSQRVSEIDRRKPEQSSSPSRVAGRAE